MKKNSLIIILVMFNFASALSQNVFPTSGPVGIGTSTPVAGADLHIRSTANYPRISIQSTSATGAPGIALGRSSSAFAWTMHYDIANQFLGFFYDGIGNRMVIKQTGKVGIATSDPRTTLDVGGQLRLGTYTEMPAEGSIAEGDFGNYILGDMNSQRLRLGVVNDLYTKAEVFIDNSNRTDGTISLKTGKGLSGAATRLFIDGDGNVSIGTTDAKGYRFAVNGDAIFTKVKVKTFATWPDYVFDTSYKLTPLPNLEKYIRTNRHLPEIPSAAEIEKDGIDVAATQELLVKKVEELTLYLIEQNKIILDLKSEVERLKKNALIKRDTSAPVLVWSDVDKKKPEKNTPSGESKNTQVILKSDSIDFVPGTKTRARKLNTAQQSDTSKKVPLLIYK